MVCLLLSLSSRHNQCPRACGVCVCAYLTPATHSSDGVTGRPSRSDGRSVSHIQYEQVISAERQATAFCQLSPVFFSVTESQIYTVKMQSPLSTATIQHRTCRSSVTWSSSRRCKSVCDDDKDGDNAGTCRCNNRSSTAPITVCRHHQARHQLLQRFGAVFTSCHLPMTLLDWLFHCKLSPCRTTEGPGSAVVRISNVQDSAAVYSSESPLKSILSTNFRSKLSWRPPSIVILLVFVWSLMPCIQSAPLTHGNIIHILYLFF